MTDYLDLSILENIKKIQFNEWLSITQVICLVITGFILSRVFYSTRMANNLAYYMIKHSRGNLGLILLYIILFIGVLSLFISNTIAVLTFIPIMQTLASGLTHINQKWKLGNTAIVLAVIYGANIGGMGSLLGTPSNYFFISQLIIFDIPGWEKFTFLSWFGWGLPLSFLLIGVSWIILRIFIVPKNKDFDHIALLEHIPVAESKRIFVAGWIVFIVFMGLWVAISGTSTINNTLLKINTFISVGLTIALVIIVFKYPFTIEDGMKRTLIDKGDLFADLPGKRIGGMIVIIMVITGVFYFTSVPKYLASLIQLFPVEHLSYFMINLVSSLVTIFSTEVMNNTPVSMAMYPLINQINQLLNYNALPTFLCLALASTSAFMTPIATVANAVAFGSLKKVSLKRMLLVGLVTNLIAAAIITFWATYIVPAYYDISIIP